jgi:hypothetical protein
VVRAAPPAPARCGQVAPGRHPHAVRLARDRTRHRREPGLCRAQKYVVKKGKTPVLYADEARALLDSIDISTLTGLRDRALIGVMVYTFAQRRAPGAGIKTRIGNQTFRAPGIPPTSRIRVC